MIVFISVLSNLTTFIITLFRLITSFHLAFNHLIMYVLTLLTFECFYSILCSFNHQNTWPPKFTLTIISLGRIFSFLVASLPLINMNHFHTNSLCVPSRTETVFGQLYLFLLIVVLCL